MNASNLYYKQSGKVPPAGFAVTLAVGILAAAILGFVYSYAIDLIPLIYINFIITAGFGVLLGMAVGWAAVKGKVRNTMMVGVLSILIGLVAVYFSWVVYFHIFLKNMIAEGN